MPKHVCQGAVLQCSMGLPGIGVFNVIPDNQKIIDDMPAANVDDNKPIVEIPTFGSCISLANPLTASATTSAMGVLTPMPCVPNTPTPWMPGAISPPVMLAGQLALDDVSKLMCVYGGVISVIYAGQLQKQIS